MIRPQSCKKLQAALLHSSESLFKIWPFSSVEKTTKRRDTNNSTKHSEPLDCGAAIFEKISVNNEIWSSCNENALIAERFKNVFFRAFGKGRKPRICIKLPQRQQALIGLRVQVPEDAKPQDTLRLDLIQRDWTGRRIIGGLAVEIRVV